MPLIKDPRGVPQDPVRYDQMVSEQLQGVSGRSEEFNSDVFVWESNRTNDGTNTYVLTEDVVLTGIYLNSAMGTSGFATTTAGIDNYDVATFTVANDSDGRDGSVFLPLPNWQIKKGSTLKHTFSEGSTNTYSNLSFIGYPA